MSGRLTTAAAVIVFCAGVHPAQAQVFKTGSFTKNTTAASNCTSGCPTNVVPHNLGTTPKAILLWTGGGTSFTPEFLSVQQSLTLGMSDGPISVPGATSWSSSIGAQDNAARSYTTRWQSNKAFQMYLYNGALLAQADLESWDATNFTLTWLFNNTSAYSIHYLAFGGNDVQAKVVSWLTPATTGLKSVNVGFNPDLVFHVMTGSDFTFATSGAFDANFSFGVMDFDGDQWVSTFSSIHDKASADTQRGQQTDACIYAINTNLSVVKKASWATAADANSFTVNFTTNSDGTATQMFSLALKGFNVKAGSWNKTTAAAPALDPVTLVEFQPTLVLLSSFGAAASASPIASESFSLGAADGTRMASAETRDLNGVGTMIVRSWDKSTKAFMKGKMTSANVSLDAEADLASLDVDGFTLNWTLNDAVATQMLYVALAPLAQTAVELISLTATRYDRGVLVEWRTAWEQDNLAFHVYREIGGVRTRVTRSMVAGSGLMAGQHTAVNAEQRYAVWDLEGADHSAIYYLEDLDFNGRSTWHGPVTAVAGGLQTPPEMAVSGALADLGRRANRRGRVFVDRGANVERPRKSDVRAPGARSDVALVTQRGLASQAAIKIGVDHTGWFRVTQPELVAAGLDPATDPHTLQLFAEGVEHPMTVMGATEGRFGSDAAIEFFGQGLDTYYTVPRT